MKVFITGGSGGLGFEIVKKLSNLKNIQLFATYYKSTAHKSIDLHNVRFIKIDFTENNYLEKIKEHVDDIDCLINNYSTGYEFKHLTSFKSDDVLNSFNNNIAPLIDINNFFIKLMKRKSSGQVISVLSEVTKSSPVLGMPIYTAEKMYFKTMIEHWQKECNQYDICFSSVSPKMMDTEFNSSIDTRLLEIIKLNDGFTKISDVVSLIERIFLNPKKFIGQNIIV